MAETAAAAVTVSVQAAPSGASEWCALARRVDDLGFESLLVADHPGSGPAPFVALAAAAAVTTRIRLGPYVANAGAWDPLALASEVATLDVVSGGRALLGVGAGHTPAEWRMRGLPYPEPADRVGRMIELVGVTRRLLASEDVSFAGEFVTLDAAALREPRPIQQPIPLTIGGNGPRVLRHAAGHADIVALSGAGRTLEDGHRHELLWSHAQIDRRVTLVQETANAAGRTPDLEALVQWVELTDDAEAAAQRLVDRIGTSTVEEVLGAPFAWIGTAEQIAEQLRRHRERWGIDRYVVRSNAIDETIEVLDALAHPA